MCQVSLQQTNLQHNPKKCNMVCIQTHLVCPSLWSKLLGWLVVGNPGREILDFCFRVENFKGMKFKAIKHSLFLKNYETAGPDTHAKHRGKLSLPCMWESQKRLLSPGILLVQSAHWMKEPKNLAPRLPRVILANRVIRKSERPNFKENHQAEEPIEIDSRENTKF